MPDASGDVVANTYGEIIRLVERLHRRYLDVIRYELSKLRIDDISAVQALLLMNVQDAEVSIRELVDRGYYIGSNVTFNVRHLVDSGYLMQNRSEHDRRSVRMHATEKGREFCRDLREIEMRHASSINVEPEDIDSAREYLRGLERVWSDSIQFGRV
jgi:DNA-binding MarR family transcriptional regulator